MNMLIMMAVAAAITVVAIIAIAASFEEGIAAMMIEANGIMMKIFGLGFQSRPTKLNLTTIETFRRALIYSSMILSTYSTCVSQLSHRRSR